MEFNISEVAKNILDQARGMEGVSISFEDLALEGMTVEKLCIALQITAKCQSNITGWGEALTIAKQACADAGLNADELLQGVEQ